MRPGLRPRLVRQIFAPMPAARSRCLASFIAIARHGLPVQLRYEPSTMLGLSGVGLLTAGLIVSPFASIGRSIVFFGWMVLALAFVALVCQHRFDYGSGRSRLIRSLDEARRVNGLDDAIMPESLEFLEVTAQQWERIEHALGTHAWDQQQEIKARISRTALLAMEEIVVLECGAGHETGLSDDEADRRLASMAANLRMLADVADAAGSALTTYPREDFESNGASPAGVLAEIADLEEALDRVTDGLSRSEVLA